MAIAGSKAVGSNYNYFENLPKDVCLQILSYVTSDSRFKHLTGAALVSKTFLELCLSTFPQFNSVKSTFDKLGCLSAQLLKEFPEQFVRDATYRLLAIDEQGYQYSACTKENEGHLLTIFNSVSLQFITLDLADAVQQSGLAPVYEKVEHRYGIFDWGQQYPHDSNFGQHIVSCHSYKNRFIIVTHSGYSLWEWKNPNLPEIIHYSSPFRFFQEDERIYNSCFCNGTLFVQYNQLMHKMEKIDVEKDSSDWVSVTLRYVTQDFNPYKNQYLLVNIHDEFFLLSYHDEPCKGRRTYCQIVYDPEGQKWSGTDWYVKNSLIPEYLHYLKEDFNFDCKPIGTSQWSFVRHRLENCAYVFKEGKIWLGREFRLNTENLCKLAIYQNFLFLSYKTGDFRLFYLPSKYECTFDSKNLIQRYLSKKGGFLYALGIQSEEGVSQLKIVYSANQKICSISIPLERLLFQNDHDHEHFDSSSSSEEESKNDLLTQTVENNSESAKEKELNDQKVSLTKQESLITIESNPANSFQTQDVENNTESAKENDSTKQEANPSSTLQGRVLPFLPAPEVKNEILENEPPDGVVNQNRSIHKMILIAGGIFALIVAAASTTLIILHPGQVIYEGSGVILTLPAVLTISLGGFTALVVLAIGSYCWWKEKQIG